MFKTINLQTHSFRESAVGHFVRPCTLAGPQPAQATNTGECLAWQSPCSLSYPKQAGHRFEWVRASGVDDEWAPQRCTDAFPCSIWCDLLVRVGSEGHYAMSSAKRRLFVSTTPYKIISTFSFIASGRLSMTNNCPLIPWNLLLKAVLSHRHRWSRHYERIQLDNFGGNENVDPSRHVTENLPDAEFVQIARQRACVFKRSFIGDTRWIKLCKKPHALPRPKDTQQDRRLWHRNKQELLSLFHVLPKMTVR